MSQAVSRAGEMSSQDVLKALVDRKMQLWVAADDEVRCASLTELADLPQKRVCDIPYCAGVGREDWQHFILVIEAWAKEQGCETVRAMPRPGWEKDLKALGYRKTHVIVEKDLVDG